MTEFLNTVLTFPTLVYSVLLAFCTVYWLLAATGIVDFDAVDGWLTTDGDTAEPNVVAGMVARLGLSGVPMMLVYVLGIGVGYGLTFFASTILLLDYFGRKPNLELFSLVNLISTAGAVAPAWAGYIRDVTGGFMPFFIGLSALVTLVLVAVVVMRAPRKMGS